MKNNQVFVLNKISPVWALLDLCLTTQETLLLNFVLITKIMTLT